MFSKIKKIISSLIIVFGLMAFNSNVICGNSFIHENGLKSFDELAVCKIGGEKCPHHRHAVSERGKGDYLKCNCRHDMDTADTVIPVAFNRSAVALIHTSSEKVAEKDTESICKALKSPPELPPKTAA
ncbi:MAG: hypothetical protein HYS21_05600 [Deltaproteobacteria bacterium]|nr:hypothetical protein [Deltaproteobacteria bacterium]